MAGWRIDLDISFLDLIITAVTLTAMTQLEAICHWPVMYGECVRILGKQWGYKEDTVDRLHCHLLRNYQIFKMSSSFKRLQSRTNPLHPSHSVCPSSGPSVWNDVTISMWKSLYFQFKESNATILPAWMVHMVINQPKIFTSFNSNCKLR